LLVELLIALLGTGLEAVNGKGAPYAPGPQAYGTPAYIGKLLLTRFLLTFEIASFLLLVAAVGGVVLARRRHGIAEEEDEQTLLPIDVLRRGAVGTMSEGVGRR
ncbi:MAG TPA: NADH-quinone oxidoreductase subunit J, partial [Solirubrobacteraceae bacterium]|nr:NADH-quinone oxidoreductase subunit J [Solirubrobacteraceae bacterium]